MTIRPLHEMRFQIEAVLRGRQKELKSEVMFKEIHPLRNTINSILTGASKNPTANTLRAIAKALDVSLEFILSDEEMNIDGLNKDQMKIFSEVTSATINIIIDKE
jgi:transcriptional regulator with XRE-family HTH domain